MYIIPTSHTVRDRLLNLENVHMTLVRGSSLQLHTFSACDRLLKKDLENVHMTYLTYASSKNRFMTYLAPCLEILKIDSHMMYLAPCPRESKNRFTLDIPSPAHYQAYLKIDLVDH